MASTSTSPDNSYLIGDAQDSGLSIVRGLTSAVWQSRLLEDTLVLPACAAVASLVLLFLQWTIPLGRLKKRPVRLEDESCEDLEQLSRWHITSIQKFAAVRLLCNVLLLTLSSYTYLRDGVHVLQPTEFLYLSPVAIYFYTSCLALASVLLQTPRFNRHLSGVLLVLWATYIYRDIWPLATYTLQPVDVAEGPLLWIKVSLLTIAAVIVPLTTPRELSEADKKASDGGSTSPEGTASLLSLATYSFLDKMIWKGYIVDSLSPNEFPPLLYADETKHLVERAFPILDPLRQKKPRHLFLGLAQVFGRVYTWLAVLFMLRIATKFIGPIGLYQLLRYLEAPTATTDIRPWFWIVCLFFGPVISTMAMQFYMFNATRTWIEAQALLTQLVFNHALRIRLKAEVDTSAQNVSSTGKPRTSETKNATGKLFNLATSDVNNIVEGRDVLQILLTPFHIAFSMIFLYSILGWSAFVGLTTILALMPVPGAFASFLQKAQVNKMKKTDSRIQAVTETITVIRMIKLFAWERRTAHRLDVKRDDELRYIRRFNLIKLFNANINYFIPFITMITTFTTFTLIMKKELTAARVFSSITVFQILREQMMQIFNLSPSMIQAKVSLDRVTEFLQKTELLDEFTSPRSESETDVQEDIVGIRGATFTWSEDGATEQPNDSDTIRSFRLRISDELKFENGSVNLIVGPTGSGKTALLLALLGELHYIPDGPGSYVSLPRSRGIAYVPQESWIESDTIRANILFGKPYNEGRFRQVIYQCGLEHDLSLFDYGDMTEVGERGLTLSGGQKARVSLARAVYSDAELLLLDDIFAALDVHTSKWIVEKCFKGDLMRERTVLLVTHNVALVGSIASFVVSMGQDGQIAEQGKWSRVLAEDPDLSQELAEDSLKISTMEATSEVPLVANVTQKQKGKGNLVAPEEVSKGRVTWKALNLYLSSMGGSYVVLFWVVVLLLVSVSQMLGSVQPYWLGYWAQQYEDRDESSIVVPFYLGIYIALIGLDCLFQTLSYTAHLSGAIRASRYIHKILIDSILGSTLRWLDRTPSSRIVTRCTQDIQTIDGRIADVLYTLITMTVRMLVQFGAIVFVAPLFSLVGVLTVVFGGWLGQVYMKAQLPVKREQSNARAPILGHLGATLSGLVTIRAYGVQHQFFEESSRRVDRYTRASLTFYNTNRWISLRLDALSNLFATCLAVYLVYGNPTRASTTGFALNMAVGFSGMVLWWIRNYNDFEVNANSLERVDQYLNIEHEQKPTPDGVPPAYWPASGSLVVENLSARYSEDGPRVLQDISFDIKSGERVGIVGRTGSGKSSLTLSLLRLIPTEGRVYYDGLPIDSVNLDILRSKITIIPQMPELLSGTLRHNLDPSSEYDDATMNDALRTAGLFSLQSQTGEDRITLDFQISSGGGNLSVGQRQILALARAILRQSKLLILDEATSAIDYETDTIIQRSLRESVSKDVTVLTIAHRLQTIMDADKILVLDSGRIAEFGAPADLLKDKTGLFSTLVNESGDKDALYAKVAKKTSASA